MHGIADSDAAHIRLLLPGDDAKQGGLAGAVWANHADNAAGRQFERKIVDQQIVAITLLEVVDVDDVLAKPFGDRDDDLRGLRRLGRGLLYQLLVALVSSLGFRLAGTRGGCNPFLL